MSYKQTLLKETKSIIEDLKDEIVEIVKTNQDILNLQNLNEWDLKTVENNLKRVEDKENLIKLYRNEIEAILTMDEKE